MRRCIATTIAGRRCLHSALNGSDYCAVHRSNVSPGQVLAIGAGAAIGNAFLPGIGGVVLGGIAGKAVREIFKGNAVAKKRVFVSFDFDNDRFLKESILGQAKLADSPFEVTDHSLKEAAPEPEWEKKAKAAIARSEVVLVMVGARTYRAQGVLKEVAMARELGVKIVQIIGYKDGNYTPVPNAGRLYSWSWENLKNLLT